MDRTESLKQILTQNPDDAFARYALAMEYSRNGNIETAMAEFNTLIEKHPAYVAGYQMAAQTLVSAGRDGEARAYLQRGMAAAQQAGNTHAHSEMEMLLADISR